VPGFTGDWFYGVFAGRIYAPKTGNLTSSYRNIAKDKLIIRQ
jgi:hypothetical protein